MATSCPIGFDVARLRGAITHTYDRLAADPAGDFHFNRGAAYARDVLRYDPADLAHVPAIAAAAFAGVGNPHRAGAIHAGETVLDHACGAGLDLIIAADRVGPKGKVIGVDMTPAMLARARTAFAEAGLADRAALVEGLYEALPVATASVDVVISNGVLNLAPDKAQVMREVARVLKPGGRLLIADVVVARELTLDARRDPELWAACIAGALTEDELVAAAHDAGFDRTFIVEHYDSFAATSASAKVSKDLSIRGAIMHARRAL